MKTFSRLGALLATCLVALACGAAPARHDGLRTAYLQDPTGGLDPDQFYDIEGESTLLSVYEGLLRYAPGTNRLEPSLARAWTVSADGLTYTFALRRGVRFHDGSPLDAQAVVTAFRRRIALKGGPSYMLASVAGESAADSYTFIVRLKQPVAAFLDYMASMYGPKIISPRALREHAGRDDAQKWLQGHADGTGPYQLVSYRPGEQLVLARFPGYWGTPAASPRVTIAINPSIGDQFLQLRSGQLDFLAHGISAGQIAGIRGDLHVQTPAALIRTVLQLNVAKPPFDDIAAREALAAALDLPAAISRTYPGIGHVPGTAYPPSVLPAADDPPIPAPPHAALSGRWAITISYNRNEPDLARLAEVLQQQLGAHGFDVRLRADSPATEFAFADAPKRAPEALLGTYNPDAAHPDAWIRPVYGTGGGLNLFGFSDPALDRIMDRASRTLDAAHSQALYGEAGRRAIASYAAVPVVDLPDIVVARSGFSDLTHTPAYVWSVQLSSIKGAAG